MKELETVLIDLAVGPFVDNPAVSDVPQDRYLNTAAIGLSRLSPADLLAVLKKIEHRAGRRMGRRWGPRPLDLDLLLFEEISVDLPELTIPHPRLRQRRFYLEPLASIAPDWRVPPDGATVAELLAILVRTPDRAP